MKTFDLKEFNKDGNTFTIITYGFSTEQGLRIEARSGKVSVRSNVGPCAGCDFIGDGNSMSSKDFFENKGTIEINNVFFKPEYGYHIKGYTYCLTENVHDVTKLLEKQVRAWLQTNLITVVNTANKALSVL